MGKTNIEWTAGDDGEKGETWNPIRGCDRVSPGCGACYAEKIAARFSKPGLPFHGYAVRTKSGAAHWTGKVSLIREKLTEPLSWKKPRRVFVNSTSDLFHPGLANEEIAAVFGVMAACPQHTMMVLTKRPERAAEWFKWFREDSFDHMRTHRLAGYVADELGNGSREDQERHYDAWCERFDHREEAPYAADIAWPLPNVWLGVSVESADYKHRIDTLRTIPAALRFLSLEPLLGDLGTLDLRDIGWCIDGGLSGSGESPAHPQWYRNNRDQCAAASVPYFHKQNGEYVEDAQGDEGHSLPFVSDRTDKSSARVIDMLGTDCTNCRTPAMVEPFALMRRVGKKAAGALLDGVEHRAFPRRVA